MYTDGDVVHAGNGKNCTLGNHVCTVGGKGLIKCMLRDSRDVYVTLHD